MNITDKEVLKEIKRVNSVALEESIDMYPDNERDERSDMEFFADEVSYCVSMFNEDGCTWRDDLEDARELLRETRYGKRIPLDARTLKPLRGYWESDIRCAKDVVNEYRRMVNCLNRLQKKGYYGKWWRV